MNKDKEAFLSIVKANITRDGINELLKYLETTDFFTAPCSTKYHLAKSGGLVEHSCNVFYNLQNINLEWQLGYSSETVAIVALFHDICKANFYELDLNGNWKVKDQLPLGHGEKSVIILSKYLELITDEMLAIRWHMSGWDNAVKGGDYSSGTAAGMSKLVTALQCADLISTYITEA